MQTLTMRKRDLKVFSTLSKIFKGDETRYHMNGVVNFKFLSGCKLQVASTDGHSLIKFMIDDAELHNELSNLRDSQSNNDELCLKFNKVFNCRMNEEMEKTSILMNQDFKVIKTDYVKYEKVIPSCKEVSLKSIVLNFDVMSRVQSLFKLFKLESLKHTFFGELRPIKITNEGWGEDNLILLMPCKMGA